MGGAILDQLSVAADLMGAIDSGTGIIMAITIIYFCIYSHLARLMTPCSFFVNWEIGQRTTNISKCACRWMPLRLLDLVTKYN